MKHKLHLIKDIVDPELITTLEGLSSALKKVYAEIERLNILLKAPVGSEVAKLFTEPTIYKRPSPDNRRNTGL